MATATGEEDEKHWKNGKWLICIVCKLSSADQTYLILPCFHFVCDKEECINTLSNLSQRPAICPRCEKGYDAKDLVFAKEEGSLYRLVTAEKCCQSECTMICITCNVKFCPSCHQKHDGISYFKNTHKTVEFRKKIYKCTRCDSWKILALDSTEESCDNEQCEADKLVELPDSFLAEVNADISSLRLSLINLTKYRENLTSSLYQLHQAYNEHKLNFPRQFGFNLPTASKLKHGQIGKIKSKLERINSPNLQRMILPFLSFLTDYLDTNAYALGESYIQKYKVILNVMLEEVSSIVEANSSTSSIEDFEETTIIEPNNAILNLNGDDEQSSEFHEEQRGSGRDMNVPIIVSTFSIPAEKLRQNLRTPLPNLLLRKEEIRVNIPGTWDTNANKKNKSMLTREETPLNSPYSDGPSTSKSSILDFKTNRNGKDSNNFVASSSSSTSQPIQKYKEVRTRRSKRIFGEKRKGAPFFQTTIQVKRGRGRPRKAVANVSIPTKVISSTMFNSKSEESSFSDFDSTPSKKQKRQNKMSTVQEKKVKTHLPLEENWETLEARHYTKLENWDEYFARYKDRSGHEMCCAFCHGGGQIIMCDGSESQNCHKSFHLGLTAGSYKKDKQQCCHMPQIGKSLSEDEKWQCFFCMDKNILNDNAFVEYAKEVYFVPDKKAIYSNVEEYFVACKFISDLYKPKESLLVRSYLEKICQEKYLHREMGTLNKIRARLMNLPHEYKMPPYSSIRQMLDELHQVIKNANKIYGEKSFSQDCKNFLKFKEVYDLTLKDYQEVFPQYFPTGSRKSTI